LQNVKRRRQRHILTVDVGGTSVKFRLSNRRTVQSFASSTTMTPRQMMRRIAAATKEWHFDRVTLGFPGMVIDGRIVTEPANLGRGWVHFDFEAAFGRPTRIMNDAVMQAIGAYDGGRMLFLGFGTALGAVAILDAKLHPMELAHLPFSNRGLIQSYVGDDALKRLGRTRWSRNALKVIKHLSGLLDAHYVIVGGGNSERLTSLPRNVRTARHDLAFVGGFRAWRRSPGVDLNR
jgi:polyphosphate glucokinase